MAKEDSRLVHLIPAKYDLGIGGCWNLAVHNEACGQFAVQLDSDDVYSGPDTLTKIVNAFHEQNCAMVVGTYQMTDFNMNPIPPGIIDHREWTEARFFSLNCFESFRYKISQSVGRITAPATTGPAKGPLPASSIPQT